MILFGKCENATVLYVNSNKSKTNDKTYYKCCVWFPGEAQSGEVPITEDVYNSLLPIQGDLSVKLSFKTSYNTDFKFFQFCGVEIEKKK